MNEEEGIGDVLDEIPLKELEAMGYPAEVVVVDGESVDRTRDIAREKGARVIIEPRRGYGRKQLTLKHGNLWRRYSFRRMIRSQASFWGLLRLSTASLGYLVAKIKEKRPHVR